VDRPKRYSVGLDMDPIVVIVLVGFALMLLSLILMRLPSARKRYQHMDDRKLIGTRVQARMMRVVMLGIAFLGPVPFAFIVSIMKDPSTRKYLLCLMILVTLGGVMGFWLFFEVARLATTEIELRKFQKEKETTKSET